MRKTYSSVFLCCAFALSVQAAEQSASMKADVLGRHVTSTRNVPKAYIKNVKKQANQKSDVVKTRSLTKVANYPYEVSIRKTYGAFEHRNGHRWYALDADEGLSESQYLSRINQIEDDDRGRFSYVVGGTRKFPTKDPSFYYFVVLNTTPLNGGASTYTRRAGGASHEHWDYKNLLKNSNLNNSFHNAGYKGNGIGISFTENGAPFAGVISDNKLIMDGDCADAYPSVPHATNVARVLNRIAPKASLYGYMVNCSSYTSLDAVFPVDGYYKEPKIYIGSHSYGNPGAVYIEKSRDIDDYIYETRTIQFASVGNEANRSGGQVSGIGRGVNVISVGAVLNNMTYDITSSWENPKLRKISSDSESGREYVKPEIANFSDILFPEDGQISVKVKNRDVSIDPYFGATSSATPYTAASTALLLDRFPFYRWHPEVVKALLITSSVKKINDAEQHDEDNVPFKIAMGVPDGKAMTQNNRSRFWNGDNGEFFNSNGQISFTESNIEPNKKYRIAIAWLSSGTYVYNSGRIPQDIDLYVDQNGERVGYSGSWGNPFEFVEFTSNSDRPLTITISRFRNDGGRVLLGYNLLRVPDEYQN